MRMGDAQRRTLEAVTEKIVSFSEQCAQPEVGAS